MNKTLMIVLPLIAFTILGCQSTQQTTGSTSPSSDLRVNTASSCANAINNFVSIIESDIATGNLNQSVFGNISTDLNSAISNCEAGKNDTAISQLNATKSKYGYPV